ncbi:MULTISPECIES: carotenoid isomerase [unclassified Tolypothrix]|uniref:carotenoid isomerase n=1 Tax=unclassified Tolypothrix TaxID=2649714 RepID=UPI0005EAB762|nr:MULTISPECIES: carotenoid isomerase [unclassified Tolypothrix]BAY90360.1 FAD dependent oxidoreductase [Microchaete diplosiphon NIES-3275]EKE98825.1 carotene isomerase [Tolypothrix sp. PCC 7601]MBE9083409.1 carotene isomerase [Tolypothrix sp. LEGE 11397]UYD24539.1 carotene isomerase [Tolypothrix sp. PCC 7712]UYD33232.1 carotene isomerase [Tolypothrix sp. PCC 7601]
MTRNSLFDVIIIGSGIGGLVTATQLAAKRAKVLVLESYLIPGGSAGYFERQGYHFDVGASMIFGMGQNGTTNLLTRALNAVNVSVETIADPVQIHYHLPNGLDLKVDRVYEKYLQNLTAYFPHETKGIRRFYDECWRVFNCLNSMDLLSLEEPRYLLRTFLKHPLACLGLVKYLPQNAGDIARRYIKDPELLRFIDMECYCWSVVPANMTPMINAGMVFSDRHYGGVNYPKGGVGKIAQALATGLEKTGGKIQYQAKVKRILTERGKAVGVELVNGQIYRGKRIVSNATRWDTFEKLLPVEEMPRNEKNWQQLYQKSPSFFSLHMGVKQSVLPPGTECHHILLENWQDMTKAQGTIFVSIPTLLDPALAPAGYHIIHAFTPDWIDNWQGLTEQEYEKRKEAAAWRIIDRLEQIFPGLDAGMDYLEVGTPRTHRRFLGREDGTYGPIPRRKLRGLLSMPFNRTAIPGLYCVGDSTFPGQGLNAVAFSGFACAHRIAVDLRL